MLRVAANSIFNKSSVVFDSIFWKLFAVRSVVTLAASEVPVTGGGPLLLSESCEESAIVEVGVGVRFARIGAAANYLAFRLNEI